MYIEGSHFIISKLYVFLSLKMVFVAANSVDSVRSISSWSSLFANVCI